MSRPIVRRIPSSIHLVLTLALAGCGSTAGDVSQSPTAAPAEQSFDAVVNGYAIGFLQRNPVVATYLGAAALDASLADIDGKLRDHSSAAIAAEDRWLEEQLARFEAIAPAALGPRQAVDREVAMAQIRFLLRQHRKRRHQERAIDTYMDEPFRGLDWQLQGLTRTGPSTYGTDEEWRRVVSRVSAIPGYLAAARQQLEAGARSNNSADHRMLKRNGIDAARASVAYYAVDLMPRARSLAGDTLRPELAAELESAGQKASAAYQELADFIAVRFFRDPRAASSARGIKPELGGDRFAFGEEEYDWALANNLRIEKRAGQLYDESWPIAMETRGQMIALAREIGSARKLRLPSDGAAAVRRVFDLLAAEHPKSDEEMIEWYAKSAQRLVEYGRKVRLFDVPADYQLEVSITPPPLQSGGGGAAYYPAPPFKNTGVGRFYVTPGTAEERATVSAASVADVTAHEGFPGHDWHYKAMTSFRDEISAVRWLTPGSVEDSSSMWEDSMASEGWGLYAEALVAEPQPGAPAGFYTAEERLYQLQNKLLRDLRVRVDIGIHTGRMTYDQAVDVMSEMMDFLPGSCAGTAARKNATKRVSCLGAEQAIFRYSKWPTQAITYRLGRDEIFDLRRQAEAATGASFSPRSFHIQLMKQGTIPVGYFRRQLLEELAR
jgi:uncharacterized protein (DUF885 family)